MSVTAAVLVSALAAGPEVSAVQAPDSPVHLEHATILTAADSPPVLLYAATNVHEDLAETFMFWVYGDKPASSAIAAKYHWFDGIDTFVTARAEIRAKLELG